MTEFIAKITETSKGIQSAINAAFLRGEHGELAATVYAEVE
ncbi:hypothetical protein NV379_04290 [Paenibacillus sp. N1-5-1-14]|nr:hypothetical protein [Paenibacillus radicibacter]MCR8641871.1 hypothetical protein [Paenibacillus radicibacter]